MPPQVLVSQMFLEKGSTSTENNCTPRHSCAEKRTMQIVWRNVIFFTVMHLGGFYGAYLFLFKAKWATSLCAMFLYVCTSLGVTAGAHRLWAHQAYRARWPLRLMLVILNSMASQDAVVDWARDHRMHHKYSDTDADPQNTSRGLFFSHIGWLLVRKHPEIKTKGRALDMSDLWSDPILRFQKKYYLILMPLACFVLPSYIPMLWNETLWNAYFVCAIFRYVSVLNVTWLVNSAAHKWGNKPFDKYISPTESKIVAFFVLGEGFHNYHHAFPWDYKTAELGCNSLNFTKLFIDAMAKIGWAYDLKTASEDVILKRVKRTGDGSHSVWGWDDQNITAEEKERVTIVNPVKKR